MKPEIRIENNIKTTIELRQKIGLDILAKNELELKQYLKEELQENIFMEYSENEDKTSLDDQEGEMEEDLEVMLENEYSSRKNPRFTNSRKYEQDDILKNLSEEKSFRDILNEDIDLSKIDKKKKKIFHDIMDNINNKGFLENEEIIKEENDLSDDEFENIHTKFLELSSYGIGARNFRESYIWQLKSRGVEDKKLFNLIDNYLTHIKNKDFTFLEKIELKEKDKKEYKALLKTLSINPGYIIEKESVEYIKPDIIVKKSREGDFEIELNKKYDTSLSLNQKYLNLYKHGNINKETKEFFKKYFIRYKYILEGLQQRRETLLKITRFLIDYQKDFFEKGPEQIKNLTRKKIADEFGYSPSTISRAVQNKYIQTEHGIFPLASLFPRKSADGTARIKVYMLIKKFIKNENKKKPLTDGKIKEKLNDNGISIGRRTVAKYRNKLKIPSRKERRL